MSLATALQIFLLTDVFFVGVLVTVAIRYARAHFAGKKASPAPETVTPLRPEFMPPMLRERLIKDSESHFKDALDNSALQLHHSLDATATQLDQLLRQLGSEIIGNELERYRLEISQLRQQAQTDMGAIKSGITAHQAELEKQLADEIAAEKQRLLQQIDTKLGNAVSSFLLETLQHNVDLGAQEPYLRALLEKHKADFIKEVDDEHNPAG